MTDRELYKHLRETTDPNVRAALNRLLVFRASRLVNPPIMIRDTCRYCGQKLTDPLEVCVRANGDAYAHQACVARESS